MKYWLGLLGLLAVACTQATTASSTNPPSTNPSLKEGLEKYIGPAACAKREACGTLIANGYADKQSCIDAVTKQATEIFSDESVKDKCSAATLQACADKYATVPCAADGRSDAIATDDCVPCGFHGA